MDLLYSPKILEKYADVWKSYIDLYVGKMLLPLAVKARSNFHMSKKVMKMDSKFV